MATIIDGINAEWHEIVAALRVQLSAAEADRDAYRARIDAVRAMVHEMERDGDADEWIQAKRLRAALDGA